MYAEVMTKWVTALRSGKYPQGKGQLKAIPKGSDVAEYCCLGVLCELAVEEGVLPAPTRGDREGMEVIFAYGTMDEAAVLPREVKKWAGLDSSNPLLLVHPDKGPISAANLNDTQGYTFDQIADLIEQAL
jgi:hypothetical protein